MRDTNNGRRRGATEAITTASLVRLAGPLLAAILVAVASVGCNSAGASDPTPVQTFKITPASGTTTPASAVTPTAAAVGSPAAPGGAITLVGQDSTFNETALSAPAGAVTIRFNNKDSGVVHNLHVFEGADAKGTSVGQTDLAAGPVDQELQLQLAPGVYHYQCDAHPTTMKGALTAR